MEMTQNELTYAATPIEALEVSTASSQTPPSFLRSPATIESYFDRARAKGHTHAGIFNKREGDDDLLCFVSGSKGKVWGDALVLGSGPYGLSGAGMTRIGVFNLEEPWDEHRAYLSALMFFSE